MGENLIEWRDVQNKQNWPLHRTLGYTVLNKRRYWSEARDDLLIVCLRNMTETTTVSHHPNRRLAPAAEAEYHNRSYNFLNRYGQGRFFKSGLQWQACREKEKQMWVKNQWRVMVENLIEILEQKRSGDGVLFTVFWCWFQNESLQPLRS